MFGLTIVKKSVLKDLKFKLAEAKFWLEQGEKDNKNLRDRIENRDRLINNLANKNDELKNKTWLYSLPTLELQRKAISAIHSKLIVHKQDIETVLEEVRQSFIK